MANEHPIELLSVFLFVVIIIIIMIARATQQIRLQTKQKCL